MWGRKRLSSLHNLINSNFSKFVMKAPAKCKVVSGTLFFNPYSGGREPGAESWRISHPRFSVQSRRLCPDMPLAAENSSLPHQKDSSAVKRNLHSCSVQPWGGGLWISAGSGSFLRGQQVGSDPVEWSSDSPSRKQDAASQLPGYGLWHHHRNTVLPRRQLVWSAANVSQKVRSDTFTHVMS